MSDQGRYHPLYDGLWNDERLEGLPFEAYGFFAFLFANPRQRPSGIYRATDEQIAADTRLPVRKVRSYLAELHSRGRIVRDGAWLFVRAYFKRQPKQEQILGGVKVDLSDCTASSIRQAFFEKYPHLAHWTADLSPLDDHSTGMVGHEKSPTNSKQPHYNPKPTTPHQGAPSGVVAIESPTNGLPEWGTPEALLALYNAESPDECPSAVLLSPKRREKARRYLHEFPDQAFWHTVMAQITASPFLRGMRPRAGKKSFVADFDWLLTTGQDGSENCVKVAEGKYHG